MEPFGTPARISTQDIHSPFKNYPLFSVGEEIIQFINQVSTYTVLTQFVNQSTMLDLSKAFETSRNNPRTSRPISKALRIL